MLRSAGIKSSQIRGNPTGAIPSQDEAVTPEGVETGREEIQCGVCMTPKLIKEFYVKDRKTGRLDSTCKACRIIQQRERTLGVTQVQYLEMHRQQKGRCGICGKRLRSRRYKAFAVDHCHITGKIRGLLCTKCNTAIGLLDDNPQRMFSAIRWVKGQSDTYSNVRQQNEICSVS